MFGFREEPLGSSESKDCGTSSFAVGADHVQLRLLSSTHPRWGSECFPRSVEQRETDLKRHAEGELQGDEGEIDLSSVQYGADI